MELGPTLRACESYDFRILPPESNQGLSGHEKRENRKDSHSLRDPQPLFLGGRSALKLQGHMRPKQPRCLSTRLPHPGNPKRWQDMINDAGQRSVADEVLKHGNNQPRPIDGGVGASRARRRRRQVGRGEAPHVFRWSASPAFRPRSRICSLAAESDPSA